VCSIVLAWRWRPGVPLVLAANRDERLDRETDPPRLLHEHPDLWGGRDRSAGGTWLAVEPATGRVAAVTNRHLGDPDVVRDPAKRSRGELPLRVLLGDDDTLVRLDPGDYNPVNVLSCGPAGAVWSTLGPAPGATVRLTEGVHALTVQDLDDPTSEKTLRLLDQARRAAADAVDPSDLRDRLAALLTSHETDPGGPPQSAACIHGDEYGTVSSSTVVVDDTGVELRYAPGRPCVTPYEVVDLGARRVTRSG
jgi:uncharacterized protein with NRDE domain